MTHDELLAELDSQVEISKAVGCDCKSCDNAKALRAVVELIQKKQKFLENTGGDIPMTNQQLWAWEYEGKTEFGWKHWERTSVSLYVASDSSVSPIRDIYQVTNLRKVKVVDADAIVFDKEVLDHWRKLLFERKWDQLLDSVKLEIEPTPIIIIEWIDETLEELRDEPWAWAKQFCSSLLANRAGLERHRGQLVREQFFPERPARIVCSSCESSQFGKLSVPFPCPTYTDIETQIRSVMG